MGVVCEISDMIPIFKIGENCHLVKHRHISVTSVACKALQ